VNLTPKNVKLNNNKFENARFYRHNKNIDPTQELVNLKVND